MRSLGIYVTVTFTSFTEHVSLGVYRRIGVGADRVTRVDFLGSQPLTRGRGIILLFVSHTSSLFEGIEVDHSKASVPWQ